MKLYLILIVALWCCLIARETRSANLVPTAVEAFNAVADYYWRDFNGLVSTAAVLGGKDEDGRDTFIGQFTVEAEYGRHRATFHLVPGIVKLGSEIVTAAYNGRTIRSNTTSNAKVLCSTNYRYYKWYSKNVQFPTNCRFVVAGYEDTSPMYIGRATVGREIITGKIFSDALTHYPGLIIPYQGGELTPESYEILTYCY